MESVVTAIDPGYERSAIVTLVLPTQRLIGHDLPSNDDLLERLRLLGSVGDTLVLEQIESFGMAVGREVFETVFVSGRFAEAWFPKRVIRLTRRVVKIHVCQNARATDSTIRQALIDRFGPTKERAIGSKRSPGPLYGLKKDEWSALALAVTYADLHWRESDRVWPTPM